jgi:hypothetical protein
MYEQPTITVYKDDPAWTALEKAGKRWFQMNPADLDRLYVQTYEIHHSEGWAVEIEDIRRHAEEVRKLHPGCVLVHL